ncbi:MAG TPA: S8 family serine peptidase [Thermoanaerobaculia bacterium]|nr:S8 family serine peptidase [Thermoanaerobaculia bacterium]
MVFYRLIPILLVSLIAAAGLSAQAAPQPQAEALEAYFVELRGLPAAEGGSLAALAAEKEAFRGAARKAGIPLRERFRFDQLWNGFSVEIAAADLPRLQRLGEVKAVYPAVSVEMPQVAAPSGAPEMQNLQALELTQAEMVREQLGFTGTGVRVAILDSGVDYDHPDLGGCFGPGCKVAGGYDFVGDAFNGNLNHPDYNPVPEPDALPDDCNGHGTLVAGMAAANGAYLKGVAPGATLLAYKIFGCAGSSRLDVLLAALERAYQDGADVVNMSVGVPLHWPQYPTALAADRLVRKGIVVVGAAGNQSQFGLYASVAPAVGDRVISTAAFMTEPSPFGNAIASYSSYGPSPDLTLKPDLGAPASPVFSTYPLERGTYGLVTGTSLASPQVAGAAALILEARPNTPPAAVRTLLQNTAVPQPHNPSPFSPIRLEQVHRQGAGMIQIADALRATARVEPSKLSLGEIQESEAAVRFLTVENDGPAPVTYLLSHVAAIGSLPGNMAFGTSSSRARVSFSAPSVTVPAGGSALVEATVRPPLFVTDGTLFGGYLVLTPSQGGPALRVPYLGFKGDYQQIQALDPAPYGYPWLLKLDPFSPTTVIENQEQGATYSLADGDFPLILYSLAHQARRVRLEVFDADTGKAWHQAYEEEYTTRGRWPGEIFLLTFDGTTRAGNKTHVVPDGRYVLKLTVLKALGDEDNPNHVETWTSPVITIDRN